MSTENVEVFNRYRGNGAATQFSIGFPYLKREYVKVYLFKGATGEEVKLSNNRFSFVNDSTIKFPVLDTDEILQEGDILTIQRETTLGSEFEFDNQRRLFPVEVMNADDLGFQQIQELRREINRSVRVNPTAEETPEELLSTVYDKLDSATEVAEQAIGAANQAAAAAKDAKDAVVVAQQQITETQAFIEQARADINQAVEDSIEYVEQEAVKAATEVVGEVVGQYTDRAETAAVSAEADANSAAANAIKAETNADEVAIYNFKNKITNCITEIPQDIKLELNNGVLTLKAGSKVYVPNGADKFDVVNVSSNIKLAKNSTGLYFVFMRANGVQSDTMPFSYCYSGNSQPTITHTYAIWYDTANNKIKWTNNNGSTWVDGYSLPICIVVNDTPGTQNVSSIDQVFNGFGYIGSTIFALPGVKGLIPNGRNDDGTLKNTETTANRVLTYTNTDTLTGNYYIQFRGNFISRAYANPTSWRYDEERNIILWNNTTKQEVLFAGNLVLSSGRVESLTPKTAFHALDYNDSSWVSAQAMPSGKYIDLTLGASGSTYTAPANGYFYIKAQTTSDYGYASIENTSNSMQVLQQLPTNSGIYSFIPAKKGCIVQLNYTNATIEKLRFIYAEGEE